MSLRIKALGHRSFTYVQKEKGGQTHDMFFCMNLANGDLGGESGGTRDGSEGLSTGMSEATGR